MLAPSVCDAASNKSKCRGLRLAAGACVAFDRCLVVIGLSFEFFFRWRFLTLSDKVLVWPFENPISGPSRLLVGDLFVDVGFGFGLEFKLMDLRKLELLRSIL